MKKNDGLLMTVILITVFLILGCRTGTTQATGKAQATGTPPATGTTQATGTTPATVKAPATGTTQATGKTEITPITLTTEITPVMQTMEITSIDYSNYYGTNLLLFPASVRKWVVEDFSIEDMSEPWMEDPKLNVWWGDDGRAYVEVTFTVDGTTESFVGGSYGYDEAKLTQKYGEYAKFQTLKFKHELKIEAEQRMLNDPAFAEIIAFAKKLCEEIEYDWSNAYKINVKKTPGKRQAMCSGYADEVKETVLQLNCVKAVQLWSAPDHAWNVLVLEDGRTLYFDLTWFDNEYIDEANRKIIQLDDYRWANITFDEELFKYSGIGYGTGEFTHALGKFEREIKKEVE